MSIFIIYPRIRTHTLVYLGGGGGGGGGWGGGGRDLLQLANMNW